MDICGSENGNFYFQNQLINLDLEFGIDLAPGINLAPGTWCEKIILVPWISVAPLQITDSLNFYTYSRVK